MVYALCPIDANFRHDTTSNLLHHNSTGNSHLLGPYEFGPNGSRNNNFVQTPMLPRGLQFQWSWYRTPRSPNELQELNGLVELVTHLHLTNDSDKWTCFVSDSKDFLVKAMRIHISKTTSLLPVFQGSGAVAMDGDGRRRWRPLVIDLNDLPPVDDDDDVARARRAQANDPVTNVDSAMGLSIYCVLLIEWTTQELNFW
ncbi:hypothetical protein Tco_1059670 [Tanacetum coccineum]